MRYTKDMSDSIIFHIDVNSAFLSWSAIKLLKEGATQDIREIPAIIGGNQETRHGIVVAKSIPAKKYGISTAEPVASAMKKCPNLVMIPPDHAYYSQMSKALMEHLRQICPVIEQVSIDECYMLYDPIKDQYPSPETCAHYIKDSVRETFGFTVNVGISDRKVLAKTASDFEKPDKVHTLYAREIQEKMWPMQIGDLHMCGKSASKRLQQIGINTVGDLATANRGMIESILKSHGTMLWNFANGRDDSTVNPVRERVKGVGNSTTLAKDLVLREEALPILQDLANQVSVRLKKHKFLAGSICVEIKYASFQSVSHQKPLQIVTADNQVLFEESCNLFDELWNGDPIRLLGVRTTKLEDEDEPRQISLFEFQEQLKVEHEEKEKREKEQKLQDALGKIQSKYGEGAIHKGFSASENTGE